MEPDDLLDIQAELDEIFSRLKRPLHEYSRAFYGLDKDRVLYHIVLSEAGALLWYHLTIKVAGQQKAQRIVLELNQTIAAARRLKEAANGR